MQAQLIVGALASSTPKASHGKTQPCLTSGGEAGAVDPTYWVKAVGQ